MLETKKKVTWADKQFYLQFMKKSFFNYYIMK